MIQFGKVSVPSGGFEERGTAEQKRSMVWQARRQKAGSSCPPFIPPVLLACWAVPLTSTVGLPYNYPELH